MTPTKQFLLTAAAAVMAATLTTASQAGEGDIKYRQAVMKAVGGHMGAMKTILQGKGGNKKDLAGHAHAMAELAKVSLTVFPEDSSKMEGNTRALDAIWEKPEDFKKVAQAFVTESAKLAEIAKKGDIKASAKQLGAMGKKACSGCHKPFREKKK